MAGNLNMERLSEWVGKTETRTDRVTPVQMAALSATLDRDDPYPKDGDPLPHIWHWLYFLPLCRESEIGPDGHARRGGFIPPLPRRMIAGGRFDFRGALRVGETVTRVSRIADIRYKKGRSGELVFVQVRHEISNAGGLVIAEDQDIVYRDFPRPGVPAPAPVAAPAGAAWRRDIHADEVLLFRFSALTFNGHRIHYDRRYVTEVEGYPGLIVHGPLLAVLLMDLLRRSLPHAPVAGFSYRAVRPIFDTNPFSVCGRMEAGGTTAALWAADHDGWLAMEASASLAESV